MTTPGTSTLVGLHLVADILCMNSIYIYPGRILDTLHAVFLAVGLRRLIEEATYQPVALLTDKIPW